MCYSANQELKGSDKCKVALTEGYYALYEGLIWVLEEMSEAVSDGSGSTEIGVKECGMEVGGKVRERMGGVEIIYILATGG